MKNTIKVCSMNNIDDVNKIRKAVSNNEGVIACEVNKEKGEVSVVYDDYFVNLDKIIEAIEDLGYTVI